jgi:hypothetical protein
MSNRITQNDVAELCQHVKEKRQARGEKTWFAVEYYNGWCHLHLVDADTEARHCCMRHVTGGTKREVYTYLQGANA